MVVGWRGMCLLREVRAPLLPAISFAHCIRSLRVVATEAQQCPTLYQFGFGGHRIEGIGDKHVPWIHNVRNTDMIAAIDDQQCMSLLRLFNEEAGQSVLQKDLAGGLYQTVAASWHLGNLQPGGRDQDGQAF